jgi:hypothetical protein
MARAIRVDQIGEYVQGRLEQLLRVTVLETDARLKDESPVKTGRFKGGWAIGQNAAPYQGPPPGDYGSGNPPPKAVNYVLGQEKLGNIYSVHNNLPYAEPLANGSSKQAPPGWVQGITKDLQGFVRTNAARIGQGS